MKTSRPKITTAIFAAGLVCLLAVFATFKTSAQAPQGKGKGAPKAAAAPAAPASKIVFNGTISGVVTGERGPEAGVWVIAETKETLTPFIKIVVTDDQGRFLLPELPTATFQVFVRGYGLVDSARQNVKTGAENLALRATTAKTPSFP